MRSLTLILKVALAWLPFFLFWTLIQLSYSEEGQLHAFASGAFAAGGAAVLSFGVWWVTGRVQWPVRLKPSFYATHLLLGLLYGSLWTGANVGGWFIRGVKVGEGEGVLVVMAWHLLMGYLLYGVTAGFSYALRIRERLRQQERLAARAEALAARAELQALRARLNPHFLFNAIHSFSALIRHDPVRAEEATEQLGDLLRYVLDEQGEAEVLLADEWRFTELYLDLEKHRLSSRLRIRADLTDEALDCLVPSYTLQPLVENAVQHGIAPRLAGGTLTIDAHVEADEVVIRVQDDGVGADQARVDRASGVGLGTLRQRLAALYGPAAHVVTKTARGAGFTATVRLPRKSVGSVEPVEELVSA